MAGGDILGIGVSALLAFQRGLSTTGHNIANVDTEGYSRQRVDLAALPPQFSGSGYIGSGVSVSSIERVQSEYLGGQVRSATTAFAGFDSLYGFATQLDSLLSNSQAGLTPALQEFFAAVNDVADDPSSTAARSVMLGQAETLVSRFHQLDARMAEMDSGVNAEMKSIVQDINSLASAIADINQDIVNAKSALPNQPPNDLLDRRDTLVNELAGLIGVSTLEEDNGALNVFIGNGQALVVGGQARSLQLVPNAYDPTRVEIAFGQPSPSGPVTNLLSGGSLGGVLEFRSQVLDPARDQLGLTATGLATLFNDQHRLGQDLNGALGTDFFSVGAPIALPRSTNTTADNVTFAISDVTALTGDEYLLRFDGAGAWTLTNQRTGQPVTMSGTGTDADPFVAAGMSISVQPVGAGVGDNYSFLLQPTRSGAADIALALTDPNAIAAAAPLRVDTPLANAGGGEVALTELTSTNGLPLSGGGGPITLTFDPDALGAGVPGFVVSGGPGGTIAYDPATDSGTTVTLGAPVDGVQLTLRGAPAPGDSFVIGDNTGGRGDNRNALLLAGLQTSTDLNGGTASVADLYGQLVVGVGARTHQAQVNRDAQQTRLNLAVDARDSVSGVNLDEEAANMLRLQQAYTAAAQVIATADTLFQELLGAVRR